MPTVATDDLLNALRDEVKAQAANGLVGTDDAAPTESDASLSSQVHSEALDEERDGATGEVTLNWRLDTSEGNGNTLNEAGVEDSSGNLLARLTHAGIDKTSDFELDINLQVTVQNPA